MRPKRKPCEPGTEVALVLSYLATRPSFFRLAAIFARRCLSNFFAIMELEYYALKSAQRIESHPPQASRIPVSGACLKFTHPSPKKKKGGDPSPPFDSFSQQVRITFIQKLEVVVETHRVETRCTSTETCGES